MLETQAKVPRQVGSGFELLICGFRNFTVYVIMLVITELYKNHSYPFHL